MNATDVQRYKRLLLAKLDELSAKHAIVVSPAPGAGDPQGDLVDQANADAEAELHIRLYQSDAHLLRAIEDALARITRDRFGVCEMRSAPISKARLLCPGLVCIATARSASSQPLEKNVI